VTNINSAPRAEFSQPENILTLPSTGSPQEEASSSLPSTAEQDTGGDARFAQKLASDFPSTGGAASTEQAQETKGTKEWPLRNPPTGSNALGEVSTLKQRLNISIKADPDKGRGEYPDNLDELVAGRVLYEGAKPSVNISTVDLRNYKLQPGKSEDDKKFAESLSGGNQGGRIPNTVADDRRAGNFVPKTADYRERRPEQILSHVSSVMKWSAEEHDQNPVEVQFGYAPTPNGSKIYSSTNNKGSQDWLAGALNDPLRHVKDAAKQNDDPDVKRNANKLLFFAENQAKRRQELESSSLSPEQKEKQRADLKLTDDIHRQMFTGTHNVVKTDLSGSQRHAEQNVAAAMHRDGATGTAGIAGTKIRCYSCSASIGPSLQDENEDYAIAGKVYTTQSSKKAITRLDGKKGVMKVHTDRSERSGSASPARFTFPPKAPSAQASDSTASGSKRPRPDEFDTPGEASQTEAFKRLRLDPTSNAAG
jgi:hypothetical protein